MTLTQTGWARVALGLLVALQIALAAAYLWFPGWWLVDLDREHNLPTWCHGGLLALAALLALEVGRLEARLLASTSGRRAWAAGWVVVASGFGYLAADEMLVIHEGLLNEWMRGRIAPGSPLQLTLAWLLVFLPAIVLTVAFLLAFLAARARACPRLFGWGAAGLGLWVAALTLEATTKSFFIPRNLYWLEVVLEETSESLGTTSFVWALWRYRAELSAWVRTHRSAAAFAVPWRWVAAGSLGLAVPVAVTGASIAWNPYAIHRYVGDDHLRAGRLDEAVRAYRAALATAPRYGRAWYRLGVAELRRGDAVAAEAALANAARLEPESAAAANDLGVALFRQGRLEEAVAQFSRAATLAPDDVSAARNLGLALQRLGRLAEAQAALARAGALRPARLRVTALRVRVPVEVQLVYPGDARLRAALEASRGGRLETAVAEDRRVLAGAAGLAAAHVGLGNELVRWRLAGRLGAQDSAAPDDDGDETPPTRTEVVFADWLRDADTGWRLVETRVGIPPPADDAALAREARHHFEHALALGAAAPAQAGLAALAYLEGRPHDVVRHIAAAREADPSLPLRAPGPVEALAVRGR